MIQDLRIDFNKEIETEKSPKTEMRTEMRSPNNTTRRLRRKLYEYDESDTK